MLKDIFDAGTELSLSFLLLKAVLLNIVKKNNDVWNLTEAQVLDWAITCTKRLRLMMRHVRQASSKDKPPAWIGAVMPWAQEFFQKKKVPKKAKTEEEEISPEEMPASAASSNLSKELGNCADTQVDIPDTIPASTPGVGKEAEYCRQSHHVFHNDNGAKCVGTMCDFEGNPEEPMLAQFGDEVRVVANMTRGEYAEIMKNPKVHAKTTTINLASDDGGKVKLYRRTEQKNKQDGSAK